MQIVQSLYRYVIAIVVSICAVGLLVITTSAQTAFDSGPTGADGALLFTTPPASRLGHAMAYDTARQQKV